MKDHSLDTIRLVINNIRHNWDDLSVEDRKQCVDEVMYIYTSIEEVMLERICVVYKELSEVGTHSMIGLAVPKTMTKFHTTNELLDGGTAWIDGEDLMFSRRMEYYENSEVLDYIVDAEVLYNPLALTEKLEELVVVKEEADKKYVESGRILAGIQLDLLLRSYLDLLDEFK